MTALIDLVPPPATAQPAVNLRIHVQRRAVDGWCADIDDELDRQPDDPYWFIGGCVSLADAVTAACTKLAAMSAEPSTIRSTGRISGWIDPILTEPVPLAGAAGAMR
ncbi:hypothetical protein ACFV9C_42670 [Kribbella sp. NPDC059898]|uniref:hypothetical protein n=1 Tax=Kribbella sp. NPDC059898 TaxID=3346995 RepID=UPI0036577487